MAALQAQKDAEAARDKAVKSQEKATKEKIGAE